MMVYWFKRGRVIGVFVGANLSAYRYRGTSASITMVGISVAAFIVYDHVSEDANILFGALISP